MPRSLRLIYYSPISKFTHRDECWAKYEVYLWRPAWIRFDSILEPWFIRMESHRLFFVARLEIPLVVDVKGSFASMRTIISCSCAYKLLVNYIRSPIISSVSLFLRDRVLLRYFIVEKRIYWHQWWWGCIHLFYTLWWWKVGCYFVCWCNVMSICFGESTDVYLVFLDKSTQEV